MHANFIWALRIIYLLCPILFLAQLSAQDTDVPFNPENMDNSSVPATPKSLRIPNWPAQLGTTKTEVKIGTRINEEHGNSVSIQSL
uniref:GG12240 n=1 Tax=Drosophila erecta TaxID=7220 RepID=B3P6I5_DROER